MTRVAAVDCGTNSTRLLVSDGTESLARLMRITRLGEGVDEHGRMAPEAIERTVSVLREFRQVIDDLGATSVRATATSAARDASNREEFFAAAEAALGVRPELLPGDDEGRLAFSGAVRELDPDDGPFLVVDIGGGSTEFIVGTTEAEGVATADMGCVRITEKFIHNDPPAPEELANAIGVVRDILDDVERELPAVREARRLVGLAGTVTTMAAVEIGLPAYDQNQTHHFVLTHDAAEDVFRTLATEARKDRIANPGLEEARADVIVGGALILVTIMRTWGIRECLVSEADILDGLVQSQLP